MPRDPSDVLTRARAARAEGRFEEALELYEYFFDHALDGDAHRYHGVRLSYCLGEWALLGEQYPLAQRRLEDRAETSRQEFERTRSRETFRDWVAINRYLGREDASVEAFVEYHSSDRPFAASIVRYLWDVLVEREHWTLCAAYLPTPLEKYRRVIMGFDVMLEVYANDTASATVGLDDIAKASYVSDVTNICLVLAHADRHDELEQVLVQVDADMASRRLPELIDRVRKSIPKT